MITQEERVAIRTRCELSKFENWQDDTYHVDGVIALLDALEAETKRANKADKLYKILQCKINDGLTNEFECCLNCDAAKVCNSYMISPSEQCINVYRDCNYWKPEPKALTVEELRERDGKPV